MAKEKFDFEDYAEWCKKNGFEANNPVSMEEYNKHSEKVAQIGEKAEKTAKQKEVFDVIAKYCGKKVKYNEKYFDEVEQTLNGIVYAMAMCSMIDKTSQELEKIVSSFEK